MPAQIGQETSALLLAARADSARSHPRSAKGNVSHGFTASGDRKVRGRVALSSRQIYFLRAGVLAAATRPVRPFVRTALRAAAFRDPAPRLRAAVRACLE